MAAVTLGAEGRREDLDRLSRTSSEHPLDVLVIGGGVVGTAAAFDAATRGLEVGLVEAQDYGQGTSSRSSKLVHGGLRYLQMFDFSLVAEALRERDLLLKRTAPHLVRSLPFVFPLKRPVLDRAFIGAGVALYDALSVRPGRRRAVPLHRHLSRSALRRRFAGLRRTKFTGAVQYFDAQVDDARLVMMLARSARTQGAALAPRAEVVDYLRDSSAEPDRVTGVRARDLETGKDLEIRAREVVLATGVWTEQLQDLASSASGLTVQASKGIHISVPADRISASGHVGVITQTEKSVLFIIPQDGYWEIGTTDTPWDESVAAPAPTVDDIDYLLEHANAVLESALTRDDVIGTWAGLRPLLQPGEADDGSSTKTSREHAVTRIAPGLSATAGGKLTTYRSMAEDVVDFAIAGTFRHRDSLTASLPLVGGQGYGEWEARADEIAQRYELDPDRVQRLLRRYGALLGEVLELIDDRPDLGRPLEDAPAYLRAEAVYAARAEGALHLEDVLERRTRLVHEVRDRGTAVSEEVAGLIAPELGWSDERIAQEVAAYRGRVEALRTAEASGSDAESAAAVAEAPHASDPT